MAIYYKVKPFPNTVRRFSGSRELISKELFTPGEMIRFGIISDSEFIEQIETSQKHPVFIYSWKRHNGKPVQVAHRVLPEDYPNTGKKRTKPEPKQPETLAQYLGRKLLPKRY